MTYFGKISDGFLVILCLRHPRRGALATLKVRGSRECAAFLPHFFILDARLHGHDEEPEFYVIHTAE